MAIDVVTSGDHLIRTIQEFGFDGVAAVGRQFDIKVDLPGSRPGWKGLDFTFHRQTDRCHGELLETCSSGIAI